MNTKSAPPPQVDSLNSPPLPYQPFAPVPLTNRAFWERVGHDPRYTSAIGAVITGAEQATAIPPRPLASEYLAARRRNNRDLVDAHWQHHRRTLSQLIANRCLRGLEENDPDDRLLDWLWSFLTEPTWVVSAHLPHCDLPALGHPMPDLASCEMAALLAEAREVLLPWIDSVSSTLGTSIVEAIDQQVIGPFAARVETWWSNEDKPHMNNWTGVCAGSILAATRSLARQGHPRPAAEARALKLLRMFVERGFTPAGECDEGLGYWCYGVGYAALGWSRLTPDELHQSVDMDRLRQIADYPRRIHLAGDFFYSGNDSGLRCIAPTYFIPWLAAATGNEWLARWADAPAEGSGRHLGMFLRLLSDGGSVPRTPAKPGSELPRAPILVKDQQVGIFRLPTRAGTLIASLGGGTNAERHNHNDLGHLLLMLDQQLILPDLGAPHYAADFFGPKRYTYLTASSRGHNCPVIAGQEQRAGDEAAGKVLAWEPGGAAPSLVLDLTSAYPPEAHLQRWTRELRRQGDHYELRDGYQTSRPGIAVTHVLWSLIEPKVQPQTLDLGPVQVALSPAPKQITVTAHRPQDLLMRDFKDQTLYQIQMEYQSDAEGKLAVTTTLRVK